MTQQPIDEKVKRLKAKELPWLIGICCATLCLLAVATSLCVHEANRYNGEHTIITAPDGEPAILVSCGAATKICFSHAIGLCPKGYDLIGTSESKESRGVPIPIVIINGEMVIRCKP